MSILKFIKAQFGLSNDPNKNYTIEADPADGKLYLTRGNAGSPLQEIMIVGTDGRVTFPQNVIGPILRAFNSTGAPELPVPANYVSVTMLFGTETLDTEGGYNPATGIYTVQRDGLFFISSRVRYTRAANMLNKEFGLNVDVTGGAVTPFNQISGVLEYDPTLMQVAFPIMSGMIKASAGAQIRVVAYAQEAGIAISGGNEGNSSFNITRLA